MVIAYTSDLHWGWNPAGNRAIEEMFEEIKTKSVNILIVAGDAGNHRISHVESCYAALRRQLPDIPVLIVWGNHDYWDSSFSMSRQNVIAAHGEVLRRYALHSLDHAPYVEPGVVVTGFMGWYSGTPQTKDCGLIPEYQDFDRDQRERDVNRFLKCLRTFREDLREEALRVMVTHFGIDPEGGDPAWGLPPRWLEFLDPVDVWISGHSHRSLNTTTPDGRVLLKNSGSDYGKPRYGLLHYP